MLGLYPVRLVFALLQQQLKPKWDSCFTHRQQLKPEWVYLPSQAKLVSAGNCTLHVVQFTGKELQIASYYSYFMQIPYGHAWIAINAVSLENGLEWGKSNLWSFKLEMGIHYSELLAQFLFVGWNLWWYHLHSLVEVMMQDKIHYWSLWSCIFSLQISVHCMWILMKVMKARVTFPDRKK